MAASAGKVSSPVTDTLPDTIAADTIAAPTKNPALGRVWFQCLNQSAFALAAESRPPATSAACFRARCCSSSPGRRRGKPRHWLALLRSALSSTLDPELFGVRQVAKNAFTCQAECGNPGAFGLPALRKKHSGGVGSLCRVSPAFTPRRCFSNTPRRRHPLFPPRSDGHYTGQDGH